MKRIRIEFKRVQTYLFEVPRLRAMLGANAAVGELLRSRRPGDSKGREGLPDLLPTTQSKKLKDLLAENAERFPEGSGGDPLKDRDELPIDNPREAFKNRGIIAQDGGHFDVLLDDENVESFRTRAEALIRQRLPGVRSEIRVGPVGGETVEVSSPTAAGGVVLPDLPHFEVCQLKGSGAAQTTRELGGTEYRVALDTKQRLDDGDRFAKGQTRDIIGLLQGHETLKLHGRTPRDLNELCGKGYLAVIHADGNGLGQRQRQVIEKAKKDGKAGLELEAEVQKLFYGMRVAVRSALVEALGRTFEPTADTKKERPPRGYQILMLGGDDLLLICRAEAAVPFLVEYARALAGHEDIPGGPITIGAGLVVSRPSVPFSRLHELAEALASSAKRLHRESPDAGSVVDWLVFSGSWAGDPIARRRREALHQVGDHRLILSGRPLSILGGGLDSLEGLDSTAKELRRRMRTDEPLRVARSQLRALIDRISEGPTAAELAFEDLPDSTRNGLEDASVDSPWHLHVRGDDGEEVWLSRLPDLVEIFEIPLLGRAGGDR